MQENADLRLASTNRDIVLRLMTALDICDEGTIREIVSPDAEWEVIGLGKLDRETLIEQLRQMLGSASVAQTTIIGTTAEGERVAVESRGNFEFADGRIYRNSYHHLFIVRDGRVTRVCEYLDLLLAKRIFNLDVS